MSLTAFTILFSATIVFGQESSESDEAALAKATQNPLAAMYSLPFQNNTTYSMGEYNRAQNVLNIQPVLPFSLGEKINLINRIILPIITQPSSMKTQAQQVPETSAGQCGCLQARQEKLPGVSVRHFKYPPLRRVSLEVVNLELGLR